MATGTPTVEESEGDKNRSEARRTTSFNVVATFVAAVIAAASGVGGVLVGASASADRDDARSDREFLRTQRIAVYSEFLATAEDLEQRADPYLAYEDELLRTPYDSEVPGASEVGAMRELLDELDALQSQIDILDVDGAVARPAADMVTAVEDGFAFFTLAEKCHVDFHSDTRCGDAPPRWGDSTDGSSLGLSETPQADSGPGEAPGAPRDEPWGYVEWSSAKHAFMNAVRHDLDVAPSAE